MSRNSQGLYTLPAGNPVVPNTLIESSWANTTMSDLAQALTDSLPRNGSAPMTAPLTLVDQLVTPPIQNTEAISLGYLNVQLETIQTGASGGMGNPLIYENDRYATANYTITNGKNGMSAGPIGIEPGVTIGIPAGSTWSIVGGGSTSGPDVALGDTLPIMDGVEFAGVALFASRSDHVHPSDTSRAAVVNPEFLGIPTAPTAPLGTNTTQIATTEFVLANAGSGGGGGGTPSDLPPGMDGVASAGTATEYSRGDHIHPSDTTKASLSSPVFTGVPQAPTAANGTNTNQLATTLFVANAVQSAGGLLPSNNDPLADGVASPGVGSAASRDDHVHPTDTSRAPLDSPAFTGVPTAPTAAGGTNTTQIATTAFVASQVSAQVSSVGLLKANNLSDLQNVTTARANLGLSTKSQFDAACTDGDFAFVGQANTFTVRQTFNAGISEKSSAIGASNIDCSLATVFSRTVGGNVTFTVSNVAASGNVSSFLLDLTNGGSATITWWAGVKWAGGVAPVLTAAGRDVLGFFTYDGGTTWTGLVLGKDIK